MSVSTGQPWKCYPADGPNGTSPCMPKIKDGLSGGGSKLGVYSTAASESLMETLRQSVRAVRKCPPVRRPVVAHGLKLQPGILEAPLQATSKTPLDPPGSPNEVPLMPSGLLRGRHQVLPQNEIVEVEERAKKTSVADRLKVSFRRSSSLTSASAGHPLSTDSGGMKCSPSPVAGGIKGSPSTVADGNMKCPSSTASGGLKCPPKPVPTGSTRESPDRWSVSPGSANAQVLSPPAISPPSFSPRKVPDEVQPVGAPARASPAKSSTSMSALGGTAQASPVKSPTFMSAMGSTAQESVSKITPVRAEGPNLAPDWRSASPAFLGRVQGTPDSSAIAPKASAISRDELKPQTVKKQSTISENDPERLGASSDSSGRKPPLQPARFVTPRAEVWEFGSRKKLLEVVDLSGQWSSCASLSKHTNLAAFAPTSLKWERKPKMMSLIGHYTRLRGVSRKVGDVVCVPLSPHRYGFYLFDRAKEIDAPSQETTRTVLATLRHLCITKKVASLAFTKLAFEWQRDMILENLHDLPLTLALCDL